MDSYNSFSGGGGGFMPGEMNSPSGGKGDEKNNTIRPVTVKQALEATQPYPEASYQIDGADVSSIVFIGQVRNISSQTTNVTYKIDDGTGEIEAKQWIDTATADTMDTDDGKGPAAPGKDQVELNGYAKIFGRLRTFGNKQFVSAHSVRPMKDINELHCHLLEAAVVHLFFTRGPPGGGAAPGGGAGAGAGAGAGGDTAMGDYNTGQNAALPSMSPAARRVFGLLKNEPQTNEGVHVQLMAMKLGLPVTDVVQASDELLTAGVIFSTVDEQTFAILDY